MTAAPRAIGKPPRREARGPQAIAALALLCGLALAGADAAAAQPAGAGPWKGDPCGYFRQRRVPGRCTGVGNWQVNNGRFFFIYYADGSSRSNVGEMAAVGAPRSPPPPPPRPPDPGPLPRPQATAAAAPAAEAAARKATPADADAKATDAPFGDPVPEIVDEGPKSP
ncbi:hypothetical protein IP88_02005 [alpha proteobacterium AAP81b]|nr:hypothetical protein IP88_02005 [alpha proteobacterium AAP81b]